jgi:hypothetical protein
MADPSKMATNPNSPQPGAPAPPPSLFGGSLKRSAEAKKSLVIAKYFQVDFSLSFEPTLKSTGGTLTGGASVKSDQLKLVAEYKFYHDLKVGIAPKINEKSLNPLRDAIKKGDPKQIGQKIRDIVELSLKDTLKWNQLQLSPELDLQPPPTPFKTAMTGTYDDELPSGNGSVKVSVSVKGSISFGLSNKGWAELAGEIGPAAMKRALAKSGRLTAVVDRLVIDGVLKTTAAILDDLSFGIAYIYIFDWLLTNAQRDANLTGLAQVYPNAYIAKLFNEPPPRREATSLASAGPNDFRIKIFGDMVWCGEQDAINDARAEATAPSGLASVPRITVRNKMIPLPPGFTDAGALEYLRVQWVAASGSENDARKTLWLKLYAKACDKLGVNPRSAATYLNPYR